MGTVSIPSFSQNIGKYWVKEIVLVGLGLTRWSTNLILDGFTSLGSKGLWKWSRVLLTNRFSIEVREAKRNLDGLKLTRFAHHWLDSEV